MADSEEPDLYSFLRSKDLAPSDDTDADDEQSEPDEGPDLRTMGSFEDADTAVSTEAEIDFEADDLGERLGELPSNVLDEAPFGIVQVDDEGIVQFYNQYESKLAGIAPEEAMGQNFFTQLAPCSGNRLFHGRFRKGVKKNALDERFTYAFTYKMSPTLVDVRMYRDEAGRNWILIRKR